MIYFYVETFHKKIRTYSNFKVFRVVQNSTQVVEKQLVDSYKNDKTKLAFDISNRYAFLPLNLSINDLHKIIAFISSCENKK